MKAEVRAGHLTWAQAARLANQQRTLVMDHIRARSTPVGRAMAERAKLKGLTLEELLSKKTRKIFGRGATFDRLSQGQRDEVLRAVVESAGRSDPKFNALMRRVSTAGRSLIVLSLGIAVCNTATAEKKAGAAAEEGVLRITLTDQHLNRMDGATIGAPYDLALWDDARVVGPGSLDFSLPQNGTWRLTVLPRMEWRLPLPTRDAWVWRGFRPRRHFRIERVTTNL